MPNWQKKTFNYVIALLHYSYLCVDVQQRDTRLLFGLLLSLDFSFGDHSLHSTLAGAV